MVNKHVPKTTPDEPMRYQIRLKGHLGCEWREWFEELTITLEDNGETVLIGPVADQSALHGLLKKIRDLGLPLLSVISVETDQAKSNRNNHETRKDKMNTSAKSTGISNVKVRLSTLWIFAILNYLYADVLGLYEPTTIKDLMTGSVGGVQFTDGFMLGAAVLMETAIVMVLLSRVLPYKANRWANIIAGVIHTTAVFASMFVGTPPAPYYLFFGSIEIATTLFIIWSAWKWPNPER